MLMGSSTRTPRNMRRDMWSSRPWPVSRPTIWSMDPGPGPGPDPLVAVDPRATVEARNSPRRVCSRPLVRKHMIITAPAPILVLPGVAHRTPSRGTPNPTPPATMNDLRPRVPRAARSAARVSPTTSTGAFPRWVWAMAARMTVAVADTTVAVAATRLATVTTITRMTAVIALVEAMIPDAGIRVRLVPVDIRERYFIMCQPPQCFQR